MRTVLIMVAVGLLSVTPVAIMGSKYAEPKMVKYAYNTGLHYDEMKSVLKSSNIAWSKVSCNKTCSFEISLEPFPDGNVVELEIFPPRGKAQVNVDIGSASDIIKVDFTPKISGWYIAKLAYKVNGSIVDTEKSFYIALE